jgi:hypothetical protein
VVYGAVEKVHPHDAHHLEHGQQQRRRPFAQWHALVGVWVGQDNKVQGPEHEHENKLCHKDAEEGGERPAMPLSYESPHPHFDVGVLNAPRRSIPPPRLVVV